MIKLIVVDMDGTLLNDQHEIHPEFWEIEQKLADKGIMFSVASGRQLYNLQDKFHKIKDRLLFFAENGTYVMHRGKELYLNALNREAALNFIEIGRNLEDTKLILCGKTSAYIETKDPDFYTEVKKYYERLEIVEDLTKVEDTILKVTLSHHSGVEKNTFPHFAEFKNEYKIAIAANVFLDITSLNANKGNAIKGIQKELGISEEETLVFGDYLNDLEMMGTAKYSYAMKNAHPEIINASNYITTYSNNENGVLKTIEELGILTQD